ncbi:flagellar hook protein, epsilonproteobacterial variant [Campylobacter pinnipediorum subsp. caledonicus]|uniref:Flagellar hook protein FlgE n=1 Tax=Campylobacter pinnipediorum subsp. caledonicus TaxID=1874362 RepID=A0A1S6U5L6_9BACT|nr:flagellar hook protein FlgE [Campylobacter pinnipediorum]AQW86982.1 flagellar hook protein, epsilonproteobacterial variant [Campylobacter pinnipediorum subsp. caledonicus]
MLRSLWSGVTGLQAHQIAMDVESNNIANVNTVGHKYSRANFSDMLSQTPRIATAPQGELGGQNPMQIGLGTSVHSTTRIFSQGTLQSTDKNTDLALQGDGFFIVSPDGGKTNLYTRNGDFIRDRAGNFVNNSGYIAQGWIRDDETGTIDSTGPIRNIVIREGLTTPARATTYINVKGNLDSGNSIGPRSIPIYTLDSVGNGRDYNNDGVLDPIEIHNENDVTNDNFYTNKRNEQVLTERGVDLGVMFDDRGNGVALRQGQGIWVSYANAETKKFKLGSSDAANVGKYLKLQNGKPELKDGKVIPESKSIDIVLNGVPIKSANSIQSISDVAKFINDQSNKTGVQAVVSDGNKLTLINRNNTGTSAATKNIHLVVNKAGNNGGTDTTGLESIDVITAYQYEYTTSTANTTHSANDKIPRLINSTEDLRRAMQEDARKYVDYNGDGKIERGTVKKVTKKVKESLTQNNNGQDENEKINKAADGLQKILEDEKIIKQNESITSYKNEFKAAFHRARNSGQAFDVAAKTAALYIGELTKFTDYNDGVKVSVNAQGQFQLENPKGDNFDHPLYISITGRTTETENDAPAINENVRLTNMLKSLEGSLSPSETIKTSSKFMLSSHGSTTEIHDSLGSKHTVNIKWAKVGTTNDGGTEWNMVIQVPEPAKINFSGEGPANVITGSLRFGPDGALASFNPSSFTFSGNNGSLPGQSVQLDFGLNSDFNGLTSFDRDSSTEYIRQDGYEGGTLKDVRVDETGVIVGAFTNGQSFGLAQVAVATFTNNEGLQAEGGNVFSRTANSGDPVIGTAGSGNKGTIAAAKLEQSNVDLSRALTNLIVIQRGFQANSKAITTSDEMLNTLLQLKQ